MHCEDPGCLAACPAPGAIVQYANGIVDVNPDLCIGCGYCETGCPFDIPRFQAAKSNKMSKCTLCVDRVEVGLEPACIKACPTGCLHFGTKEGMVELGKERVAQLRETGFPNASLYNPPGVGGTGVVTVLAHGDHPEWYGLPKDPVVPLGVRFWKRVLRPLGLFAVAGSVIATAGHYMSFGPKVPAPGPAGGGGAVKSGVAGDLAEHAPPEAVHRARTVENIAVGDEIIRHRLSSRVIHWSVAATFVVALLSGLPIWTPIFHWMGYLFGGLTICRWLHPWAGSAFFATSALMFMHWIGEMKLGPEDKKWIGPKMIEYLRFQGEDPEVGKYNGGQKIFFFAAVIGAIGLVLTGIVMWFPLEFPEIVREAAIILHDITFILLTISVVGHIYLGTAAEPGTFRAMVTGSVSKTWARLHHPRWFREVTGEERRR